MTSNADVVYLSPYAATAILKHCKAANASEASESKLGYLTGNYNATEGHFTITNILPIVQADLTHLIPFSPNDTSIVGLYFNVGAPSEDVKAFVRGKKNRLFFKVALPSEENGYKLKMTATVYSDTIKDGQQFSKKEISTIQIKYDSAGCNVVIGAIMSEMYPDVKAALKNSDLLSLEAHIRVGKEGASKSGAAVCGTAKKSTEAVEEMMADLEAITAKDDANRSDVTSISALRGEIRGYLEEIRKGKQEYYGSTTKDMLVTKYVMVVLQQKLKRLDAQIKMNAKKRESGDVMKK